MKSLQCLVVENEELLAAGLAQMLRDAGHQVAGIATHIRELATLLARCEPDLVALDLDLGRGTEGIGIATVLQATGRLAIVFVAEKAEPVDVEEIASIEGASLLLRPFAMADLVMAIEQAVSRAFGDEARG